jgi:RimJ/RimL family protein N-acetyltransferase
MHWAVVARRPGEAVLTDRLLLAPAPVAVLQAVLEGRREEAQALLGASIDEAWPPADVSDFLPDYASGLVKDPSQACWGVWLMIDRQRNAVVGDLGFKGAPDEAGQVEIGYGVLPQFQRRGYAFEAATGLVDWAFRRPEVRAVLADCLPDNAGSVAVLRKLGMTEIGRANGLIRWRKSRI